MAKHQRSILEVVRPGLVAGFLVLALTYCGGDRPPISGTAACFERGWNAPKWGAEVAGLQLEWVNDRYLLELNAGTLELNDTQASPNGAVDSWRFTSAGAVAVVQRHNMAKGTPIWMVGRDGYIEASFDFGYSISEPQVIDLGITTHLTDIDMVDGLGVAVGHSSTILHGNPAKTNWSVQTLEDDRRLNAVAVSSTASAVAVGDGGLVAELSGGWSIIDVPTTADLRAVDLHGGRGVIVGDHVVLWLEGDEWVLANELMDFVSVAVWQDRIWAIGVDGGLYESCDGGTTWTLEDVVNSGAHRWSGLAVGGVTRDAAAASSAFGVALYGNYLGTTEDTACPGTTDSCGG